MPVVTKDGKNIDVERVGHDKPLLSSRDFRHLSDLIHKEYGIKMPDTKKTMLEARLSKRLRQHNYKNYAEYLEYVFSPEGIENELHHMIDAITTNKTDFFREPAHFDYLTKHALPQLLSTGNYAYRKKLTIWSAGCSSGEEPYTLAMVLSDFAERIPDFEFSIIATDISTKVLNIAIKAVYEAEKANPIPYNFKKKYLLRSKDKNTGLVKIAPEIRQLIQFRRVNLMEAAFDVPKPVDIIFCRNVVIYFDRPTQEGLINRFCRYLNNSGYLFMGHSETLNGFRVPLAPVAPTIYRRV